MDLLNKLITGELRLSQVLYLVITKYKDSFNPDFLEWVEHEANGYKSPCVLPMYRYVDCDVYAKYRDAAGVDHDEVIDVSEIDNLFIKTGHADALISKMRMTQGVESLERALKDVNGGTINLNVPASLCDTIKQWYHFPANFRPFSVYQSCPYEQGIHLLTVVKSKLIDKLNSMPSFDEHKEESAQAIEVPLVFISHSSKDKQIVKLFVDNILKKGLGLKDESIVFTSYEATGVPPCDNIPQFIKRNIKGAKLFLAMISKNYKDSEVCMNEVGASWALEKTPIQILLPKTSFERLGWLLHLDKAVKIDERASLDSLEETICKGLNLEIPTAKHWNPCVSDLLEALNSVQDLYDK